MGGLGPYKVITAVVCWSNDNVTRGEFFERALKNRSGQMGTVAVEGDGASLMTFCEVGKYRSEACRKTFTFLRNYARLVACQPRQCICVRLWAHDGDFHIAHFQFQRPRQRQRVF